MPSVVRRLPHAYIDVHVRLSTCILSLASRAYSVRTRRAIDILHFCWTIAVPSCLRWPTVRATMRVLRVLIRRSRSRETLLF